MLRSIRGYVMQAKKRNCSVNSALLVLQTGDMGLGAQQGRKKGAGLLDTRQHCINTFSSGH